MQVLSHHSEYPLPAFTSHQPTSYRIVRIKFHSLWENFLMNFQKRNKQPKKCHRLSRASNYEPPWKSWHREHVTRITNFGEMGVGDVSGLWVRHRSKNREAEVSYLTDDESCSET